MYHDLRRSAGLVPSLSAQVAREIGSRIIAGVYPPGELIEGEALLSVRYKVSRSVIRDAVKVLAGKGLLDARRGIGVRVRARENWSLLDDDVLAWHQSLPPNHLFLRQLMETCAIFEPKAAYYAAQRAKPEEVAAVNAACGNLTDDKTIKGAMEQFTKAEGLFHRAVIRAAHNEFLTAVEGVVYSALLTAARLLDRRGDDKFLGFHRDIADAIAQGKADKAESAMMALLKYTEKQVAGEAKKAGA